MDDQTLRLYHELWPQFFPKDAFFPQDSRLQLTNLLFEYFHSPMGAAAFPSLSASSPALSRSGTIPLDMQRLRVSLPFQDVEHVLTQRPQEILACLSLAISRLANVFTPYLQPPLSLSVTLYNLSQITGYSDVKSAIVGQFVAVEGQVVRVTTSKPLLVTGRFHCVKCNQSMWFSFEDGIFDVPPMCATKKCYNKLLEFDRNSVHTTDYQHIKLTELDEVLDNAPKKSNIDDSSAISGDTHSTHNAHSTHTTHSATHTTHNTHTARVPRTLDVEVRGELVNGCVAGDRVRVCGTVKAMAMDAPRFVRRSSVRGTHGSGESHTESGLHQLYLLANSVTCVRHSVDTTHRERNTRKRTRTQDENTPQEVLSTTPEEVVTPYTPRPSSGSILNAVRITDFSREELQFIRSIALSPFCVPLFVQSLCETICGHESVKLGLLLSILGGCEATQHRESGVCEEKMMHSQKAIRVRENVHVLIVGDPGLGKSQLLRSAAQVAPRSVFVSGQTSTTAGLTVTLTRDGSHTQSIEAGALVLADRGVCCIDELDKIQCDSHTLCEAMEQQCVSVAKAGVVASLWSRCAVIAAANPVKGHYSRQKSVCENLKMHSALLSRFDLVFILLDEPDAERDTRIGEHILGVLPTQHTHTTSTAPFTGTQTERDEAEAHKTLTQRLRAMICQLHSVLQRNPRLSLLTHTQMKRYVEYAHTHVHPTLSREAARHLQQTYLSLRAEKLEKGPDSLPVTTRHLESLIRLSQARARLELREEVTLTDAQDVTQLLHESLWDSLTESMGRLGEGGRRGGNPNSLMKQMKALVSAMQREAKMKDNALFHTNDMDTLSLRLRLTRSVSDLVELMHTEGYIIKKGPKLYQLLSV